MQSGKIVVISGPSGVGKTTLYKRLLQDLPEVFSFSVSATTRPARAGETNGKDYYFISRKEFKKRVTAGEFVEWANVYGNLYGTLKAEIIRILETGKNCLLDVDVQGGMSLYEAFPKSVLIFIAPPASDELRRRITERNLDKPEVIEARMKQVDEEMAYIRYYHHIIVNRDVEDAYLELKKLVLESIK
jgi:guanylate kinase